MDIITYSKSDLNYPATLTHYLGERAPTGLHLLGEPTLWSLPKTGIFCSNKCPGAVIIKTHDYFREQASKDQVYISGFQSPIEKECLRLLFKRKIPVIICLARGLHEYKYPKEYQDYLDSGLLLLLSPFEAKTRRLTNETSVYRNQVTAALADAIFMPHAAQGSKTHDLSILIWSWKKRFYTIAENANSDLLQFGAQSINKRYFTPADVDLSIESRQPRG